MVEVANHFALEVFTEDVSELLGSHVVELLKKRLAL
jgi:hypothetical protein